MTAPIINLMSQAETLSAEVNKKLEKTALAFDAVLNEADRVLMSDQPCSTLIWVNIVEGAGRLAKCYRLAGDSAFDAESLHDDAAELWALICFAVDRNEALASA